MLLPLVFLRADGSLFVKALVDGLLCSAFLTLHRGGVHEGNGKIPVPAHCMAKKAAEFWELLLLLATVLSWVSWESVCSQ